MRSKQQVQNQVQTKVKTRQKVAHRVQTLSNIALRVGFIGGIAMAVSLLFIDLNQWGGSSLGYRWSLSATEVKPGGYVTATLEIPEVLDLEDFSFLVDLPRNHGFKFIPGSLKVTSGTLAGALIKGYSGESILQITEIPAQREPLRFEVGIQVPEELAWLGKTVELVPRFTLEGRAFRPQPTWLQISAAELQVETQAVAGHDGSLGYEITVTNPEEGVDFESLETSFRLELDLPRSEVSIREEAILVLSENANHPPRTIDERLIIDGLSLAPGKMLSVFVPMEAPDGISLSQIQTQARVMVGSIPFGKGPVATLQEFPVKYDDFQAEIRDARALLTWKVLEEKGNKGFMIEHSENGNPFAPMAFLPGSDDHQDLLTYQYESKPLTHGRHLFRIRQDGFQGNSTYTQQTELFVGYSVPSSLDMSRLTSRSGGFLQLTFQKGQQIEVWVTLESGARLQTLFEGRIRPMTPYDIYLPPPHLPSGRYQIEVKGEASSLLAPFTVES